MEGWIGFLIAGFALAGSPGPATLSLAATGAGFGARRGLWYMTGILAGMVIVILVTASGMTGVVWALPGASWVVVPLAGAYFCYLAWRIATAPPLAEQDGAQRQPSFAAGVLLSLINPKAYAAMAALQAGFVRVQALFPLELAFRLAALVGIMLAVNLIWLLIGTSLTRFCQNPRISRAVNVTWAVLLMASLALALWL
ncbi:MAG TPA: LysE family translocator [bacterium]|nr:LysE family translocator [bacterium]